MNDIHIQKNHFILAVCMPYGHLKIISVRKDIKVGQLSTFLSQPSIFLHNGHILKDHIPLNSQGIYQHSFLVALPSNSGMSSISSWLSATKNNQTFTNEMLIMSNPKNFSELCRLRDIKIMKAEGRSRFFNLHKQQIEISSETTFGVNLTFDSLNQPSEEPLPSFWNE